MEKQNQFVIQHHGAAVVSIADVPAGAEYVGILIDALRAGKQVGYQRGDLVEEIQVKPAPVKALKSAEPAAPIKRHRRRMKKAQPAATTPAPVAAAAKVVAQSKWKQGDVVFLAWSSMTPAQHLAYADMREAMGTVETFRRGPGIKRTVGVKFDTQTDINWFHPDELSDKCESCIEERAGVPETETEPA